MTERYAFTVIHRAADLVMEEFLEPTPDGHSLSFVGHQVREDADPAKAAISNLKHELGFNALTESQLVNPKSMTYHAKTGYFYELLIPGDTEILKVNNSRTANFVLKGLGEVLQAARDGRMMELSDMYVNREWM